MTEPTKCPHKHRRLIAKDEHEEYVECLDCGVILESAELSEPQVNFPESLSDA
jgi:transcription initiation factor TFIIIB Brf1 subunit/transcription initiation factor TFIIB